MVRALGDFDGGPNHVDVSFRDTAPWRSLPSAASTPLTTTSVLLGDDACGPVLLLLHLAPDAVLPDSAPHGHASDSWRMPLRGTLPMGRDRYEPGDFRFQRGWRPYASDNLAHGPDGGWTVLLFGDRRGMRPRPTRGEGPAVTDADREWGAYLEIDGDLAGDELEHVPASTMVTTLDGDRPGPRVNGSFGLVAPWSPGPGAAVAAGAIGDADRGPIVLLVELGPGRSSPALDLDADVARIVVRGSYALDGRIHHAGDIRAQGPGRLADACAGPEGASEVIVVADRRALGPGDGPWAASLAAVLADLEARRVASAA